MAYLKSQGKEMFRTLVKMRNRRPSRYPPALESVPDEPISGSLLTLGGVIAHPAAFSDRLSAGGDRSTGRPGFRAETRPRAHPWIVPPPGAEPP
jgi:hypothetical protein